jgi:hypothetical protein
LKLVKIVEIKGQKVLQIWKEGGLACWHLWSELEKNTKNWIFKSYYLITKFIKILILTYESSQSYIYVMLVQFLLIICFAYVKIC